MILIFKCSILILIWIYIIWFIVGLLIYMHTTILYQFIIFIIMILNSVLSDEILKLIWICVIWFIVGLLIYIRDTLRFISIYYTYYDFEQYFILIFKCSICIIWFIVGLFIYIHTTISYKFIILIIMILNSVLCDINHIEQCLYVILILPSLLL